MSRFSDVLMEYYEAPLNRGTMADADATGRGSLNGHPPRVTIFLKVIDSHVTAATFEAEGCGVTIAAASALTVLARGSSLQRCLQLSSADLSAALDGVPEDKQYCLDVAIIALRMATQQASAKGS
ncbi:MAG: iron-sulfur cluster assembly scaffold protein [Pirellulales bacterium]